MQFNSGTPGATLRRSELLLQRIFHKTLWFPKLMIGHVGHQMTNWFDVSTKKILSGDSAGRTGIAFFRVIALKKAREKT